MEDPLLLISTNAVLRLTIITGTGQTSIMHAADDIFEATYINEERIMIKVSRQGLFSHVAVL